MSSIALDGCTPLHVFERGCVSAVRLRNEVLELYNRIFTGAVGPDFVSMDYNARHIQLICSKNFWNHEDILRMDWPVRSPDLTRIVPAWDGMGREITTRKSPSRTLQRWKTDLLNEWN
ncbi:transposable element Tcb2 transposase [Trichonephila clavipes]|nr:transposable element Tcb2 transposase [Trichonephila clavipes]